MFVNFNILNQLGSPAINSNTFANRPAAGQTGRLFVSTDTFEIYRDNGTTWDLIGGPGSSTITGTGTATQVAYFTSSQAIGSSANLFWDNTSGFLGVATATPTARIEAVKTDGIGIYANYTTNAGSGSSATAIWAKNVTNSSGFAAVIEETTPNATAGQYPLLIKHSLSSGTAGVGMGTGLHFQLPDDAGTFKTTQLTIETINAAAASYATRYRFNVQSNGSSTPVAYINATGVGIFTATPGAALDIHSTGIIAQLNSTSATANSLLAFQRSGSGLWRIGDNYGGGTNYFELFNTVLGINAMQVFAATNKTSWQATETYTTGQARGNYFDYNLSVAAGGSFSSPNAITALGASLDLTLAGNATIPSGARSGLDAYNSIAFTGAGTLTHNQGTQIRAYSNLTAGWAFNGSAIGTITHLAGLRALFPDNSGSAVNVTNNYALLLNDQTANTGTVTYTNRWGIYQEGASDLNYMAANLLLGSTTNSGEKLQVTGNVYASGNVTFGGTLNVSNASVFQVTDAGVGTKTIVATFGRTGAANSGTAREAGIVFRDNAGTTLTGGITGVRDNSAGNWLGGLKFYVNSNSALPATTFADLTNAMSITSAASVGIGTSVPRSLLHVSNGDIRVSNETGSTFRGYIIGATASDAAEYNYLKWSASSGELRLFNNPAAFGGFFSIYTNAVERARFTAGGNFLIATTVDTGYKLQVTGSGYFTNSLTSATAFLLNAHYFYNGGGTNDIFASTTGNGAGSGNFAIVNTVVGAAVGVLGSISGFFKVGTNGQTTTTADRLQVDLSNGNTQVGGYIKTAAPTTGTSGNWKLGSRVAATVALDTTQYIEVDIGGTLYKLAIVT